MYNNSEKVDMLLIYGECLKNSRVAAQLYADRYPERRHPCHQYFAFVENKFREENDQNNNNFVIDEETEINVLAFVEANNTASLREIGKELQISHESSRKILKKHKYRSFKYQLHQHLYEDDANRRIVYCDWLLQNNAINPNFTSLILFSDESRFTNNGMFNRQNTRYWAQENRHMIRETNFQERFGVNVWAGVIGTKIIGPILFQEPLTAERYLGFLQNEIEEFLMELPLEVSRQMYFQQDGAPPHNAGRVLDYLIIRFNEQVVATNGPVRWPARSPDLTILDFFVWGYVKDRVYRTPPANLETLENRIREVFTSITPVMLTNIVRNTTYRARKCYDEGGGHFEHLLP